MTKDVKFSCNFHVFLLKNHADTSLIEFKGTVSPMFLCDFEWPKNIFESMESSK